MPVITRADLRYTYQWNAIPPDDPRVTGKPDSTFLNRHEGYEVLPFLNRFADKHKGNKDIALKAERLINTVLPSTVRSQANVTDWLERNWASYI